MDAKKHGIDNLLFIFSNKEAYDWYYPLKPYTLLEYKWVRDNLVLEGKQVIDAGCHHGNYAIVFKPADVHAIDSNPAYIKLMALKSLEAISKDPAAKMYFLNSDSPQPLPLMHLGDDMNGNHKKVPVAVVAPAPAK